MNRLPRLAPQVESQRRPLVDWSLEAKCRPIEACEPRLALSASLTGGLLVELLNLDGSLEDDPTDSLDLIDQASELRDRLGLDGSGQTVAVIDSGIAWDHVALGGGYGPGYRIVGGWDFAENDADPYDDGPAGYHGSHVAGLLAGSGDGFAGVAPAADLVALRVFDDHGTGQLDWIESSLQWVIENQDTFEFPITTVNLSVGAALSDDNRLDAMEMLEDELSLLREHDILVFAATGNLFGTAPEHDTSILYPASSTSVVGVASVDADHQLSEFAQREPGILATGGESVTSSVPDHVFGWDGQVDDFAMLSGTSMATPQVAGASMLVRQALIDQGIEPTAEAILARMYNTDWQQPSMDVDYHVVDLASAIGNEDAPSVTTLGQTEFTGTAGSERIELDLRNGIQLSIGNEVVALDASVDTPLVIDVGEGDDSLQIIGSPAAERLTARPPTIGNSSIATNSFHIELIGFEQISFDGGGGIDRAAIHDSPTSDQLSSHPGRANLSGIGFEFQVTNIPKIYVHASEGQHDTAFLHDSETDDSLQVRPQFTSLRNAESFQLAYGFERVYAYATAGGSDSADLYDSPGDDTMFISPGRSMIAGNGYQVSARGFESAVGNATGGGHDVAKIYADQIDSRWHMTDDMVQWTGADNSVRIARGFEQTEAFENHKPIDLSPQSSGNPLSPWWIDDAGERAKREADAARSVFAELGHD